MTEFALLQTTTEDIPQHLVDEWADTRLHGQYRRVTELLVNQIGSTRASLLICDEALNGWCCLESVSRGRPIIVEEVLPSWRLLRLVRAARGSILPGDPAMQSTWFSDLSGDQQPMLEIANLDPAGLLNFEREGDVFDLRYRRWMLDRFVQGLNMRLRGTRPTVIHSLEVARQLDEAGGFQPLVEYYPDGLSYSRKVIEDSPDLLVRCYAEVVYNGVAAAVCGRDWDLTYLRVFEQGTARLIQGFDEGRLDVRSLLIVLVGEERAKQFRT